MSFLCIAHQLDSTSCSVTTTLCKYELRIIVDKSVPCVPQFWRGWWYSKYTWQTGLPGGLSFRCLSSHILTWCTRSNFFRAVLTLFYAMCFSALIFVHQKSMSMYTTIQQTVWKKVFALIKHLAARQVTDCISTTVPESASVVFWSPKHTSQGFTIHTHTRSTVR